MHKVFRLPGLFLFILTFCVCGCSGSGSSADPMGTGTVQFVSEFTSPIGTGSTNSATVMTTANVPPNGSLTLTVYVSNYTSEGKTVPVMNEKVTFTLDSPENGARLTALNDRTASNGQARVAYMAGNNLFPDVVRVTTRVGATASIMITKTGTTTRGSVVSLAASQNPAVPLGFSTITATVTDNGFAVQGERVNFALLTNNGASLSIQSGLTNAAGQVTATYQAGNNQNEDLIQASLGNGSVAQIRMTKTTAIRGVVIALAANPAAVLPLGFSTITATVTDNGVTIPGERVTFALTSTDTGASLSTLNGTTNAKGEVITTYQAGNNNKQDVVQASLASGAKAQVIITKTGVGPGVSIALVATPNPVAPARFSIITATVKDSANNLVSGATVRFGLTTGNGSISRNELSTDGNGVASIIYYAWDNLSTDVIEATTDEGGYAQLIITKSGQVLGYTATLTANPATFTAAASPAICNTILTVTVLDSRNNLPKQGMRVRIIPPTALGFPIVPQSISPASALTGIDGKASFNVSVTIPEGTVVVEAYVDVNDNGVQDPTDPTAAATLTLTVE
jgi:hypothetical protein